MDESERDGSEAVRLLERPANDSTRIPGTTDEDAESAPASAAVNASESLLAKPIVLRGSVTDRDGAGIGVPRARVTVTDASGRTQFAPIGKGAYRIGGLEPGPFDLGCDVFGFRHAIRTISLRSAETEHREDFVLESVWTIAIRLVTPEGRNLLDRNLRAELPVGFIVGVVATVDPPEERLVPRSFKWRLAHRGSRYEPRASQNEKVPGDPSKECSGRLEIFSEPPVHVSAEVRDYIVATKRVDAHVDHLTLEIPIERLCGLTCSLSCRLVDAETRGPISGAKAGLFGAGGGTQWFEADESGALLKEKLLPGAYTLTFQPPGYAYEIRQVDLAPGRENDLGTIALERGVTLQGRFVDPEGRPLNAEGSLFPYSEEHALEAMNTHVQLGIEGDEDGRFEGAFAKRKYLLLVNRFLHAGAGQPDWRARPITVDLTRGPIFNLVIPLRPGVDLFLHPLSMEAMDLYYSVVSPDGLPCVRGGFPQVGDTRDRIAPGSYRLLLDRDGSIVREIPFTLGEQPMTLDIDL